MKKETEIKLETAHTVCALYPRPKGRGFTALSDKYISSTG